MTSDDFDAIINLFLSTFCSVRHFALTNVNQSALLYAHVFSVISVCQTVCVCMSACSAHCSAGCSFEGPGKCDECDAGFVLNNATQTCTGMLVSWLSAAIKALDTVPARDNWVLKKAELHQVLALCLVLCILLY